ncbi:MAG: beta-Ala-His dipeptidase [Gaiellaceae bacterium]
MSAQHETLEPGIVWERFFELTALPRPSREEEAARTHVLAWAERHGWEAETDAAGNVVVRVPPAPGREDAPAVVLQAHLDMVCERDPDSPYDPREGRIHVVREGDWLAAEGTTLGADNGIGVALAMGAAEDPSVRHGPLELLFTVCEEQGLEGAKALEASIVTGRLLVNLDGTSDGAITVGCAGSSHTFARIRLEPTPVDGGRALRIELTGARGGHSGGDIHRGRANAVKGLGRLLDRARAVGTIRLVELEGGVSRNAIPREARAVVWIAGEDEEAIRTAVESELAVLLREHAGTDDGLVVGIAPARAVAAASVEASDRALDVLRSLPTGVVALAHGLDEVAETSTSVNVATTDAGVVVFASMTRSSSAAGLEEVVSTIERIAETHAVELEVQRSYRPWEPDLDSPLLASARATFRALFEADPRLDVVHGGLECAVIGEKLPGIQMISIGPTILGPHAPGESVSISATQRAYRLLAELLDDLSR